MRKLPFRILFFCVFILVSWLGLPSIFALQTKETKLSSFATLANDYNVDHHAYFLVYVGFSGCNAECPITLSQLNTIDEVKNGIIPVLFVDLLAQNGNLTNYAAQFNPRFKTLPFGKQEQSLSDELLVWWKNTTSNEIQVQHSDRLYLIKKENKHYLLINSYKGSSVNLIPHLQQTLSTLNVATL